MATIEWAWFEHANSGGSVARSRVKVDYITIIFRGKNPAVLIFKPTKVK